MPFSLKRKTVDQLVAEYCGKWATLGYRVDGKGEIVLAKSATDVKLRTAAAGFEAKGYDPKAKLFLAGIANAKEIDRMNEVLDPTGIMVDSYVKNSVLLMYHDHRCALGQVSTLKPEDNGVHFEAWAGDPAAGPLTRNQEEGRSLISQRILKAVSVGFIPHKIKYPSYNDRGDIVDPAVIEKWEMLELSVVAVPCNANSLFEAKAGNDGKEKKEPKRVWAFPTLGADGRLVITKPKQEAKAMDEELKELLLKLGVSLDAIASGMNAIKDGQTALQKSIDGMAAAGKGKPPKDDEEEEDEDEKAAKAALAALQTKLDETVAKVAAIEETLGNQHKTLELLVTKITGEQAA